MKKIMTTIICIVVAAIVGVGGFFLWKNAQTKLNDGYVNGNTAGNLYNGGLFCERDGTIYFANPSDNNTLYSMNVNGSDLKKLSDDKVSFINVDDHYIYYTRSNPKMHGSDFLSGFLTINTDSLIRMNRDGSGSEVILDPDPSMYASLIGNYIYYLHYDKDTSTTLYKVKIDGSEPVQILDQPYFTASTEGQYMYYNGIENDHYIWRLDTSTDNVGLLYGGNCWMPIVKDGVAYYMDVNRDYAISCTNLEDQSTQYLGDERVDCFNVHGDYIYFQRNEDPALCRMRTDGSEYEEIVKGTFTNIHVTSHYVYFRDFSSNIVFYAPTRGNGEVAIFSPGEAEIE